MPTPSDLNRLIMDYLVIEGYKSAAEHFSSEANLPSSVDFNTIESRANIRDALQRGDVENAITLVNDLDPEVRLSFPSIPSVQDYTLHAPRSGLRANEDNHYTKTSVFNMIHFPDLHINDCGADISSRSF